MFSKPITFGLGVAGVTVGTLLHFPMFFEAANESFKMVGMPMTATMLFGMVLIVGGLALAVMGLVRTDGIGRSQQNVRLKVTAMDNAALSFQHWKLLIVLVVALIIDVMKPATLGFVVPGMIKEYGITKSQVALLPLFALTGTIMGSLIWGRLGDMMGRRGSILLAALMFVGTSICGTMPSFAWNDVMCFLMGLPVGGLLPIAFTLLAEIMPARSRSLLLVVVGGVGAVGGYLAAAAAASLLEPHFTWRALWLLGMPTGLLLILLNRLIPESPRFLLLRGRNQEAQDTMRRYGAKIETDESPAVQMPAARPGNGINRLLRNPSLKFTLAINFLALSWGVVNFGFLLWLPTNLRENGFTTQVSGLILTNSALISFFGIPIAAWLQYAWSTKNTIVLYAACLTASLLGFFFLGDGARLHAQLLAGFIAVLLVSTNGLISMLIPYAAETYPSHVRATGTGIVAGFTKAGGIVVLCAALLTSVPSLSASALITAIPVFLAAVLLGLYGIETRGRPLEEISLKSI